MPTYLEYSGYELSHYTTNRAAESWTWSNGYGYRNHGGGYGGGGGGGGRIYHDNMSRMATNRVVFNGGGSDLLSALVPSSFPPGTDPKFIELFNRIDRDSNGSLSDIELQCALSLNQMRFSLRTVHLLIFLFTGSTANSVGPKEFIPLVRTLQTWKACFEKYDRNKNGSIDEMELKEAMLSMGFNLNPFILKLLVDKYDKSGAKSGIEYDYFIECCLLVKGLSEKFKMKEDPYTRTATFTYEEFLLSVLPFVIMN